VYPWPTRTCLTLDLQAEIWKPNLYELNKYDLLLYAFARDLHEKRILHMQRCVKR
jgi:hypothetical protein